MVQLTSDSLGWLPVRSTTPRSKSAKTPSSRHRSAVFNRPVISSDWDNKSQRVSATSGISTAFPLHLLSTLKPLQTTQNGVRCAVFIGLHTLFWHVSKVPLNMEKGTWHASDFGNHLNRALVKPRVNHQHQCNALWLIICFDLRQTRK